MRAEGSGSGVGAIRRVLPWVSALVLPAIATALQLAIYPFLPPSPQLLYFPTVFVVALVFGLGPGAVCSVVSALAMAYWFLPPVGRFWVASPSDLLDVVIFSLVSVGISLLAARVRAARLAAERAEGAKDAVVAMVSHDLRSPLDSILLATALLERVLATSPIADDTERAIRIIRRSTERAQELIRNVLVASTAARGQIAMTAAVESVTSMIAEALDLTDSVAIAKGVRCSTHGATDARVECDRARVVEALVNVIANGIKFTAEHGQVRIAVEEGDREVRIAIEDDGPGVSNRDRPHLFDPYWRGETAHGGFGLGLFIARTLVEANRGTIELAEGEGGAKFVLTFPKHASEA